MPAVQLGDPGGDGKSQPGPTPVGTAVMGARPVPTVETLEDVRLRCVGNAHARILYADRVKVRGATKLNADSTIGGRVFDRVVEQVEDHPPDQIFIAAKEQLFAIMPVVKLKFVTCGQRAHGAHAL